MLFNNKEEIYKIKASEFSKMKQEFEDLIRANETLRAQLERKNFENLLEEINGLTRTIKILKNTNEALESENKSLLNTITRERASTSLVLKKLQEVTDIYERSYYKEKSQFKTALDLIC